MAKQKNQYILVNQDGQFWGGKKFHDKVKNAKGYSSPHKVAELIKSGVDGTINELGIDGESYSHCQTFNWTTCLKALIDEVYYQEKIAKELNASSICTLMRRFMDKFTRKTKKIYKADFLGVIEKDSVYGMSPERQARVLHDIWDNRVEGKNKEKYVPPKGKELYGYRYLSRGDSCQI